MFIYRHFPSKRSSIRWFFVSFRCYESWICRNASHSVASQSHMTYYSFPRNTYIVIPAHPFFHILMYIMPPTTPKSYHSLKIKWKPTSSPTQLRTSCFLGIYIMPSSPSPLHISGATFFLCSNFYFWYLFTLSSLPLTCHMIT